MAKKYLRSYFVDVDVDGNDFFLSCAVDDAVFLQTLEECAQTRCDSAWILLITKNYLYKWTTLIINFQPLHKPSNWRQELKLRNLASGFYQMSKPTKMLNQGLSWKAADAAHKLRQKSQMAITAFQLAPKLSLPTIQWSQAHVVFTVMRD